MAWRGRVDTARVAAALVLAALAVCAPLGRAASGGDPQSERVRIAAVVDGDTVRVERGGREVAVRLIGVDTPEIAHHERPADRFGPEAAAFARRTLAGQSVRLEFEPDNRIDRYGRLLAYVFLDDGTFFNRELVRLGYARAYTRYPFRYRKQFRADEAAARAAGRGLWAATPALGRIIGNRQSRIYHRAGQRHYDDVAEPHRVYFDSEEAARRAGYRPARR